MAKDDDFPDIPSWDELGISPDELAELEKELEESGQGIEPAEDPLAGLATPSTPSGAVPASMGSTGGAAAAGTESPSAKQHAASKDKPPKQKAKVKKEGGGLWGRFRRSKKNGGVGAGSAGPPPPPPSEKPRPAGGSASRYRGPVVLVAVVAVAWMASWNRVAPRPVPATAPDSAFSSERAFGHLSSVARAAHPPGSPEHAVVRGYLVNQLRALGLDPQVQTTTEVNGRGTRAVAATVRNVIARIPGSASTGAVLVTAHYDGRELSFGAGDDGVGVVTILEAVRALLSQPQLRNDVIVLLTDAEEVGLLGAQAFVNQHPWIDDVAMVLSIEMRGGGGPSIMFETGRENGWVLGEFAAATPAAAANSLSYELYKRLPNDTDFSPFRDIGKQGLNFAAIGRAHVYHQQYDNPENLSERTLQHHGVQALAMLQRFGAADLSGELQAPDQVYFGLPFVGVIVYAPWVSNAMSVLLLLLAVIVVVIGKRRGARPLGVGVGFAGGLVFVGVAIATGLALTEWLPAFHVEAGALHGSRFHSEGWYVLALVAAMTLVTFGSLAIAKRTFSIAELALGAVLIPVVAAIAVGPFVPMAAMNLQWPALAGLLGALIVSGVGRSGRVGILGLIALLVLSVPVIAFYGPLIEILWLAMNITVAPVLGVLIVLGLLLLLPLVDAGRETNGWGSVGVAAAATATFMGVGLAMARPSASRPEPSTLIYALDREAGTAFWGMDASLVNNEPASTSTPELRAGLAWAIERGGAPDSEQSLERFVGSAYQVATAAAPRPPIQELAVALGDPEGDSTSAASAGGNLKLRIRSSIGAELIYFFLPESGARVVSINGQQLPNSADARVVLHWGEPDGSIELELRAPSNGPTTFAVAEHHFRPGDLVGPAPFVRPPGLAPNINRLSDRAMIRTAISIDPATGSVSFLGGGVPVEPPPTVDSDSTGVAGANPSGEVAPIAAVTASGGALAVSLFGRDQISSVAPEFAISFAPDGRTAYFNRASADRSSFSLLASILTQEGWSDPEVVPFASDGLDFDPFVTQDGNRIYFGSDRPRAGAPKGSVSIWYVDRTPSGWSEPVAPRAPLNSDSSDVFISTAVDGTVVFSSRRGGERQIYQTRVSGDSWEEPTLVRFGSVALGGNPLIAPDGTALVFAMDGPIGNSDLYVSCRQPDGAWGVASVLPEPINSAFTEFAPAFHPDGRLLFTSERPGILGPVPEGVRPAGDIYQTNGPVDLGCS